MPHVKALPDQSQAPGFMPFLKRLIQQTADSIISILDWLVGVTERLTVLAVAFVIFYIGWQTVFGDQSQQKSATNILNTLSEKWKGLLLLLIPLFYRALRTFLERVRKAWGLETEKRESDEENKGE